MKTSQAGIELIKQFEGVRLNAYLDSVGIPTIGVGHTRGVEMGDHITEEQADMLLAGDLDWAEAAVNKGVRVPINQNKFDALVSLTFNIGSGAFAGSTLLKRLNAGLIEQAADQFLVWNRGGGRVIKGLMNRRSAERDLFLS